MSREEAQSGSCEQCESDISAGSVSCDCGWRAEREQVFVGSDQTVYERVGDRPRHGGDLEPMACAKCGSSQLQVERSRRCDFCARGRA